MAKPKKGFRLSQKATKQLNISLGIIKEGINNVCELHTHDSRPSIKQSDFEVLYIEKLLAPLVSAVRASIKSMTDGLTAQKEAEALALKEQNAEYKNNPDGEKENQES